jgi:hypothetical protein
MEQVLVGHMLCYGHMSLGSGEHSPEHLFELLDAAQTACRLLCISALPARGFAAKMSKAVSTKTGDAQNGAPLFKSDALHLTFCVVGVVGSLLLYGVLQVRQALGLPESSSSTSKQ